MSEMSEMSEIIPKIFIGSINDAGDEVQLIANNITHVICCIGDWTPAERYITIENILYIPLEDNAKQCISSAIKTASEFIKKDSTGNYLVHCHQGISRSTSIVAGYLIREHNMDVKSALELIKEKRACSDPNSGFVRQLNSL